MLIATLFAVARFAQANVLAQDARLDKLVTFSTRAEPISVALGGLSKMVGVSLHATGPIDPEVVLLNVHNRAVRDVLARLARACGGIWTAKSGELYLSRSPGFEEAQAKAEHAILVDGYRKALALNAVSDEDRKPFELADAERLARMAMAIERQVDHPLPVAWPMKEIASVKAATPVGRFGREVLAQLDPEMLASVPRGERRVFSTSPTSMELPLNLNLAEAARRFSTEQNAWSDAAARLLHAPSGRHLLAFDGMPDSLEAEELAAPISRVVVVVSTNEYFPGEDVKIHVVTTQDRDAAVLSFALTALHPPQMATPIKPGLANPKLSFKGEERLLALSASIGTSGLSRFTPVFDAPTIEHARHPDRFEPLAGYVTSAVIQIADFLGLDVVADVPDAYQRSLAQLAGGVSGLGTTGEALNSLHGPYQYLRDPVQQDGDCLEIDGGIMLGAEAFRSDRKLLATVLSSNPGGDPPIETTLAYVRSGGETLTDAAYRGLLFAASGEKTKGNSVELHVAQALSVINGERGDLPFVNLSVRASRLDPTSISAITKLVFYQESYLLFRPQGPIRSVADYPTGIRAEPCEVFPNGLPSDSTVNLALSDGISVKPPPSNFGGFVAYDDRLIEAENFAFTRYPLPADPPTFRPYTRHRLHFDLNLGTIATDLWDLDAVTPMGTGYVTFEELPKAFRDEVQRAADARKAK